MNPYLQEVLDAHVLIGVLSGNPRKFRHSV